MPAPAPPGQPESSVSEAEAMLKRAAKALLSIADVRNYLEDARNNLLRMNAPREKVIEIALFRTATRTQQDADSSLKLVSGQPQRVEVFTIESRPRSRFRLDAGVVYSGLAETTYKTGINGEGKRVIQTDSTSVPVIPMVFLSYYWRPVDPREACPLSRRSGACSKVNLLPTVTVGIPLTRNPLEHFFVGGMWQPIPYFAFTAGAHIGRVNELRSGFTLDAEPPSVMGFQDKELTTQSFKVSYFVGGVITSDVFVKILLKILK